MTVQPKSKVTSPRKGITLEDSFHDRFLSLIQKNLEMLITEPHKTLVKYSLYGKNGTLGEIDLAILTEEKAYIFEIKSINTKECHYNAWRQLYRNALTLRRRLNLKVPIEMYYVTPFILQKIVLDLDPKLK